MPRRPTRVSRGRHLLVTVARNSRHIRKNSAGLTGTSAPTKMESDFRLAGDRRRSSMSRVSNGKLYIAGRFTDTVDGRTAPVHEKATGDEIGRYADASATDVDLAVAAAVW